MQRQHKIQAFKFFEFAGANHRPVTLANPSGERRRLWASRGGRGVADAADLGDEARRRERQRDPLNRRDDAAHVLPRHGRHALLQVALERELERDRHDGLGAGACSVPGAAASAAGHPAPGRADLKGGREVQRAVGARCVLTEKNAAG